MKIRGIHSDRPCVHCGLPSSQHYDSKEGRQRCVSGGPPRFYKPAFGNAHIATVDELAARMPDLGNQGLVWNTTLTEREINAVYAVVAFTEAACVTAGVAVTSAWWKHYGPTLLALSQRLFDESEGPNRKPPVQSLGNQQESTESAQGHQGEESNL
jgi:hypothetical protein